MVFIIREAPLARMFLPDSFCVFFFEGLVGALLSYFSVGSKKKAKDNYHKDPRLQGKKLKIFINR